MKILIVEDSLFVQNVVRNVIMEQFPESEIIVANNGEKGYEQYVEHKPDLITMDLLMPVLQGHELLKQIREDDTKTPVIIISADVQKATRDEVEELGINGFINKPVTGEKIEQLIRLIKEVQNVK